MNKKKLKGNLMLLTTAFIWGTAFVARKSGMNYVGPFTFNGIRVIIAAIVLIPIIVFFDRVSENARSLGQSAESAELNSNTGDFRSDTASGSYGGLNKGNRRKMLLIAGAVCGTIFFAAGSLQQAGLQYTAAGKAGFITALYVVFTPVLGLFLKKKVRALIWACVCVSALGLFLLCVPAGESFSVIGRGEILLFLSSIFFAIHTLSLDYFVKKTDGIRLSQLQFAVCGVLSLPMVIAEAPALSDIAACAFPLFYAGAIAVGAGYTLQAAALKDTDATSAALIVSLESVFSVLAGAVLLSERMSVRELSGCALMFAAIIVSQLPEKKAAAEAAEDGGDCENSGSTGRNE